MKGTNRFLLTLLLTTIALAGILTAASGSHAQTASGNNDLSFELFGFTDEILEGPYDNVGYNFSIPANWELQPGAKVELDLEISAFAFDATGTELRPEGNILVSFNGTQLDTIRLDQNGPQTVVLDIPNEALVEPENGRYSLNLRLDSGSDCTIETDTNIRVKKSSLFTLPHRFTAPPTDLTLFPRPFYQRSFDPDVATVVIPAEPSLAELQAAYTVMAGLSRLSSGNIVLDMTTADQLPENLRLYKNLIFVAQPEGFEQISEVEFPTQLTEDGFRAAGANVGDGLIQMAGSPWNTEGVVLLVSGENDEAIIKASRALSTGNLQVSRRRNLAVVADVQPERSVAQGAAEVRTFAQLGYGQRVLSGLARDSIFTQFNIPFGVAPDPTEPIYLDLQFLHASVLDYGRSGLTISLNENLIGSIVFSEESTRLAQTRIPIPAAAIRPGVNDIRIEANLQPTNICSAQNQDDLWVAIRSESTLTIPLVEAPAISYEVKQLSDFTAPFTYDYTLGATTIVIPRNDLPTWQVGAQLAAFLGDRANAPIIDFELAYADDVSPELRQSSHLLIVGRPSTLAIIEELNEDLPVAIEPNTDDLAESVLPVTYRLPRNANLGYLELMPAPWDNRFTILTVMGRTEEGVQSAANALITSRLRGQLNSNFATVVDTQIAALNTALFDNLQAPAPAQGETAADNSETQTASSANPESRPSWLYPALVGSVVLMGIVILIALVTNLRGRFARKS